MSDEQYLQFFKETDRDGSGTLTMGELVSMLRAKGYSGSDTKIRVLLMLFLHYFHNLIYHNIHSLYPYIDNTILVILRIIVYLNFIVLLTYLNFYIF